VSELREQPAPAEPAGAETGQGEDRIRVLIIDDTTRTLENLSRLLAFEDDIEVAGTAPNALEGLQAARRLLPDVILTDVNMPGLDGIQATEMLSQELPQVPVIIVSVQDDREYLRRAMQSGAREYLVKPFSADEVESAIRRVADMSSWRRRLAPAIQNPELAAGSDAVAGDLQVAGLPDAAEGFDRVDGAVGVTLEPEAAAADDGFASEGDATEAADGSDTASEGDPEAGIEAESGVDGGEIVQLPPPLEPRHRPGVGQVTAVFSGKGGVGKTLVCINLAAALVKYNGGSVALVDLDLQFGDVAVMLGMDPAGTISNLADAYPEIDGPFIGRLMPESQSGYRVLCSPTSPELAELVTPEHVRATIEILKGAFDHVIVDCSSRMDDITLEALENADRILMVTDLNLPAVKDAKLALRVMEHLGISRERMHLVLNRCDAPSDVSVDQLESNLKFPVTVQLPSQGKLVLVSIQKGESTVKLYPNSPLGQRFRQLAELVMGKTDALKPAKSRRGLFSRAVAR
jgi:MinD-like ATPase involved in chromosome partitioning or flagellar assembly/CheY-like chemotaxis protein